MKSCGTLALLVFVGLFDNFNEGETD